MSSYFRQGTNIDTLFQSFASATATQFATLTGSTTNFRNNTSDIRTRYAGRDNYTPNWLSTQTFYNVNGIDICNNFNRFGAQFILQISGSFMYDKTAKTPSFSYNPTNVGVPNISNRIDAGTYNCSTVNSSNTISVGTNIPSTYVPVRSGQLIITPRPITFTFSGSAPFTGNPYNVTDFITVGGSGFPSGVTYSVSPSTATSVDTYNNSLYTFTIVGDSASNYSISKQGSFQITPIGIDVYISGERLYNGFCLTPSVGSGEITTVPSGYETSVAFNNCVTNPGSYTNSTLQAYSTNPNVVVNTVFGSFLIYTTLVVTVGFPGTAMYAGPSTYYKPSVISVSSQQGAPVPGSLVNQIVPLGEQQIPGDPPGQFYPGSSFVPYTGYDSIYREGSYAGGMTIVDFQDTLNMTQTVNSNGIGNIITLVSQGSLSFGLPPGVSYTVTTSITDTGIGYPQNVSATNGNCTVTINGDNPNYYIITVTGTITILAPPN